MIITDEQDSFSYQQRERRLRGLMMIQWQKYFEYISAKIMVK